MAKGGGSLGKGRRTLDELASVPSPNSTTASAVQRVLLDGVGSAGGRVGLPPEVTSQIEVADIDVVTSYVVDWVQSHAVEHDAGHYFSGRPGLWHCFDELVPLQDPNRWNSLRAKIANRLEGRGWLRVGGSRSAAWLLPDRSREPAAFVLTYNPDYPSWTDVEFDHDVVRTASGTRVPMRWSTGNRTSGIAIGDRAYLLQQVRERGIIASGTFVAEIEHDDHWAEPGRSAPYARIEWDLILHPADRLPIEELETVASGVHWQRMLGSGIAVPDQDAVALAARWEEHVADVPFTSPEEGRSETYEEGKRTRIEGNRYERNRRARAACIAYYGPACQVCLVDFGERYGDIGAGFIHVHHVIEVSTSDGPYVVDPISDLRPVCPNCHAMLHTSRPAMSVDELRTRMADLHGAPR